MATPRMTSIDPVTRLRTTGEDLLANRAAICAKIRVLITQIMSASKSGSPPMAKWLIDPVSAVALIMKTLVPTAVFSS